MLMAFVSDAFRWFGALSFHWSRPEEVWTWTALCCALGVPLTLALGRIDHRTFAGDNVWAKPFKFALALSMHFATFAVVAHFLPEESRDGVWMVRVANSSSVAGLAELAYISLQAGRARASHFNIETRWELAANILMGIGALFLLFPAFFVGIVLARLPAPDWLPGVAASTAAALIAGGVLTLMTTMPMGRKGSHFLDAGPDTRRKMWLTGWSFDRVDARPSHFMATHMMQTVPLASLLVATLLPRSYAPALTLGLNMTLALLWIALTLYLFVQTGNGRTLGSILRLRPAIAG
jgi:hypothetical protein